MRYTNANIVNKIEESNCMSQSWCEIFEFVSFLMLSDNKAQLGRVIRVRNVKIYFCL